MALKKFKPVTAGTRWRIGNAYAELTTDTFRKVSAGAKGKTGGRNSQGPYHAYDWWWTQKEIPYC
jgi:large subunit ribosomal protein L2